MDDMKYIEVSDELFDKVESIQNYEWLIEMGFGYHRVRLNKEDIRDLMGKFYWIWSESVNQHRFYTIFLRYQRGTRAGFRQDVRTIDDPYQGGVYDLRFEGYNVFSEPSELFELLINACDTLDRIYIPTPSISIN